MCFVGILRDVPGILTIVGNVIGNIVGSVNHDTCTCSCLFFRLVLHDPSCTILAPSGIHSCCFLFGFGISSNYLALHFQRCHSVSIAFTAVCFFTWTHVALHSDFWHSLCNLILLDLLGFISSTYYPGGPSHVQLQYRMLWGSQS